jgi:hypothetical protein
MGVSVTAMGPEDRRFEAKAWVNDAEIYHRELTTMFWSAPLADMGAEG